MRKTEKQTILPCLLNNNIKPLTGKQASHCFKPLACWLLNFLYMKTLLFLDTNNLKNNECILWLLLLSYGLLFPAEMGILAVLALPLLLLGISGIIYIYQSVRWLLSKSAVQNKVVVITDAISGLGKGELSHFFSMSENRNSQRTTL